MDYEPNEYQICKTIAEFATFHKLPFFHISNEGLRTLITGSRLKAIGLKRGAADYFFMHPEKKGLFLEVKTRKGKVSKQQKYFIELVNTLGYQGIVAHGLCDCLEVICVFYGIGQ